MQLRKHTQMQSTGPSLRDTCENLARPGAPALGRSDDLHPRTDLLDLLIRELQLVRVEREY